MTTHPHIAALLGDKEPTSDVEKGVHAFLRSLPQDDLEQALAMARRNIRADVLAMIAAEATTPPESI